MSISEAGRLTRFDLTLPTAVDRVIKRLILERRLTCLDVAKPGWMTMENVREVPRWEKFELLLRLPAAHENPFLDVRMLARFDHEGKDFWIDGFYDGREGEEEIWRVRFAPMFEGRWSYRLESSSAEFDGRTGEFVCVGPVGRGGLVVTPQFPNWFFRQDGRPQFIINDGWMPHPGGGLDQHGSASFEDYPSEEEFLVFLDTLGRHRVNMFLDLKQLYARQMCVTDDSFLWPWATVDAANNTFDSERFNLRYFQRLDRQIEFAASRGIFYGVEALYDNSVFRPPEWNRHPWNKQNGGWIDEIDPEIPTYPQSWFFAHHHVTFGWDTARIFNLNDRVHREHVARYLAYLAARTSAYWNVFYALGSETGNIFPDFAEGFSRWWTYWAEFLASRDPHGRLCSFGDTGERESLVRNSRNHIIVTQEHTSMDDPARFAQMINAFGKRFWRYQRPVVVGEQDLFNNNRYETERVGRWVSFACGLNMARVDRHMDIAKDGRLHESTVFGLDGDPPIYTDLEHMAMFVEQSGIRYWRMSPHDELVIGPPRTFFCLAEPEVEYMVYFRAGGEIGLRVEPGTFEVRWFNPRAGEFGDTVSEHISISSRFTSPDESDWVLYLCNVRYRHGVRDSPETV